MTRWSATVWEALLVALGWVGLVGAGRREPPPISRPTGAAPPDNAEPKRAVDPVREAVERLKEEGVAAAEAAGSGRPQSSVQARLKRSAAARIAALHKGPFDPANSAEDAALHERLDDAIRSVGRRGETVERLKVEEAGRQAAIVAVEPRPRPPQLAILTCIIAYAIGIGASLLVLPGFAVIADQDPVLAMLVTGTIGLVFGTLAVAAQFDLYPLRANETPTKSDTGFAATWPLVAGALMIFAFGLIRGSAVLGAETATERLQETAITLGLVTLDLCVLVYAKASSLRYLARMDGWVAKHADRPQFIKAHADILALLNVAETDLAHATADRAEAVRDRAARELFNFDQQIVGQWAADEAVAAYLQRVDEIAARLEFGR